MKYSFNFSAWKLIPLIAILVLLNNAAMAQVDTTKPVAADTTTTMMADTATTMVTDTTNQAPAAVATTAAATSNGSTAKSKRFLVYVGGNSNTMSGSTERYNTNSGTGYHVGIGWEKGGFVYYQFGLRYNEAVYGFNSKATSRDTGDLKVQTLDVPLTLGINFLSFAKIVSLRAFVSAMPSFTLGVSDNHFGVSKDDVNSFIFYGQIGIGANIAFAFIDLGYNYGMSSLLKNSVSSTNPGQTYVSVGVRF